MKSLTLLSLNDHNYLCEAQILRKTVSFYLFIKKYDEFKTFDLARDGQWPH